MNEKLSEAEISMLLDTFMYLDYKEAREGTSLKEILLELEHHPDYGGGGIHAGEYTVLKKAVENKAMGELIIHCQSGDMGYDTGTAACTFTTPDESRVYVVYRGTGDGEWPDNGVGMTSAATIQQERALSYFEQVIETMEIVKEQRVIVTGHSKGGNKAQFIAMETRYQALLDVCYSVDGQGFSEQAIEGWRERYGEAGYESRRGRIYGIHGENDFVSVLGHSVIPQDRIRYVRTPVEKTNFAGCHDIKYMFATLAYDQETQEYITTFQGRKNSDTGKRGELGEYAALLSCGVMELTPERRDGCAAVIMQLMEASGGQKKGLNGERLSLGDLLDFTFQGIPLIARSLLGEREGRKVLGILSAPKAQPGMRYMDTVLQVHYGRLLSQGYNMVNRSSKIYAISENIRENTRILPCYLKNCNYFLTQLIRSANRVEKLGKNLEKTARMQEKIAKKYQQWDGIDFFDKIR